MNAEDIDLPCDLPHAASGAVLRWGRGQLLLPKPKFCPPPNVRYSSSKNCIFEVGVVHLAQFGVCFEGDH